MEITIHTGETNTFNAIHVSWRDHNGEKRITELEVNVLPDDKPRTLEIKINGIVIATIPAV